MKKKILISGSKGFVGRALISSLPSDLYDVSQIKSSQDLDLCDLRTVVDLPNADIIVHLASKSYVPDSFTNPEKFYRNNFLSTLNLLEKAKKNNSKFIFVSTYVYGRPSYLPIDENHPTSPLNPYTQSKLICEELCNSYARDFGIDVIIIRPFNIYGPGQNSSFLIPTILNQLKLKEINLNDPRPKRDYVHVDDFVNAIRIIIDKGFNGYNIFNIGTGKSYSISDIMNIIIAENKHKIFVKYSEIERKGEVLETIANINKFSNHFGWSPKIEFKDGIKNMLIELNE
jgi:nucleoside-diphosphate-sugar epimerase